MARKIKETNVVEVDSTPIGISELIQYYESEKLESLSDIKSVLINIFREFANKNEELNGEIQNLRNEVESLKDAISPTSFKSAYRDY